MGLLFFSTRKIGISIDDEGIRYMETSRSKDGIRIHQAGMVKLDKGLIHGGKILDQDAAELQVALASKELPIRKRKVTFAVPSSYVVIRKLMLPPLPAREIRALIEVELESSVHLPFSRPYFDFHKLETDLTDPEAGPQDHYLVIAAPGDMIDQYVSLLRAMHLEPAAADIEPLALGRVLASGGMNLPQTYMLVQMGLHSINVGISQQEVPQFVRNIPLDLANYDIRPDEKALSSAQLYTYLQERNTLRAFSEDLSRELERVINFYQFSLKNDGSRIETIFITGDFPDLNEILRFLQERMPQIHVQLLPLAHIHHDPDLSAELHAYSVALGLSLRG